MDEQQFNDKYWQTNTKIVTVVNPRTEDFIFPAAVEVGIDTGTGKMRAETRRYGVKAGGQERFPGPVANLYLDQMAKMLAQDDDAFSRFIDFSTRATYYDKLIVSVEDLIESYNEFPQFKQDNQQEDTAKQEEIPFAGVKQPDRPKAKA